MAHASHSLSSWGTVTDLVPGGCTVEEVAPLLREAFEEVFGATLIQDQHTTPQNMAALRARLQAEAEAAKK